MKVERGRMDKMIWNLVGKLREIILPQKVFVMPDIRLMKCKGAAIGFTYGNRCHLIRLARK